MKIRSLLGSFGLLVLVVIIFRLFCSVLGLAGTMDTISDGMIVKGGMVAYANEDYEATPGPCPDGGTCTPVLRDENYSYIHVTGSLDPYLSWASVGYCIPCTCPEYDVQNVVGVMVAQVKYTPTPLPSGSPTPTPEYFHIYKYGFDEDYWRAPNDYMGCQPASAEITREATQLIPKTVTGTTPITGRTASISGDPDGCPVYRSDRKTPCAKGYSYIFDVSYTVTLNEEGGLDLTYTVFPQPSFPPTPTPQPCQSPFVHDVEITVCDSGGNYAYASTTETLGGWTDTWEWDGHFTLGNIDWDHRDILTIQFTGYVAGFTAEYYGNEPPGCTGCAQRDVSFGKEICYGCVDIDVHRPQFPRDAANPDDYRADFDPDIVQEVVPEEEEESPGAGIRLNGNHLAENRLEVNLFFGSSGLTYKLEKNSSNLVLFSDRNGTQTVLGQGQSSVTIPYSPDGTTVWAENGYDGDWLKLSAFLPGAQDPFNGADMVKFYRFRSLVVILGGEFQHPAPYIEENHGIFRMGTRIHNEGWNVFMYDEDGVDPISGAGQVCTEVEETIKYNATNNIVVYGHSHGGCSTHDLCFRLNSRRLIIQYPFTIGLTGYLDAIYEITIPPFGIRCESRWPPSSTHHINYYETWYFLDGCPMDGPPYPGVMEPEMQCEVTCGEAGCCGWPWGTDLDHQEIDDSPEVLAAFEHWVDELINP